MIKEEMNNEEWYVILNMNCQYEICRMCPKSGLFKGSYEECEKWIEQKKKEEMKDELQTWKKASENNSYKAFQLQEANKRLAQHILELQNGKGELVDKCKDLEKENAELKEKYVKNICDCDICDTYCNSQLIKAKEIIKTFLGFAEAFGYSPSMDKFIAEAEQFLSEVEK